MVYTKEVENMCPVNKGTYHGPAPIPQEGKWTQVKEVSDKTGYLSDVSFRRAFKKKLGISPSDYVKSKTN